MAKKLSAYNRYMRSALKGKMRGKTKAQRKAIFKAAAKGWKRQRKGSTLGSRMRRGKPIARNISRRRSTPKTRTRKSKPMGKKRGFLSTQTFMKFARLAALAAPAASVALSQADPQAKIQEGIRIYTGYNMQDGSFSLANAAQGWLPFVATSVLTYGITKLNGIIRRI